MHIYFSGIGGAGIGPLAQIAHQAGYLVSGSDKTESSYTEYLQRQSITVHVGQTTEKIEKIHAQNPIDWLVISSAIPLENPNHPELEFARKNNIKISKRSELINLILREQNLKLVAIAGTHGKTTATAMYIWACKELGIDVSYSLGAKIDFGDMGHFSSNSEYFVYECDEFDRNFLEFEPQTSIITTVDWDHHDIYPTREDYKQAFRRFIKQSGTTVLLNKDSSYLELQPNSNVVVIDEVDAKPERIKLAGMHNRQNALVVAHALHKDFGIDLDDIFAALTQFPGSTRRFEKLSTNIYSDYAHTPEEIVATIQMAKEINKNVVVVYEPLTNKRQNFMKNAYKSAFMGAKKVYWLPTYLAREDPTQHILTPNELIVELENKDIAVVAVQNDELVDAIKQHASQGDLVLCLAGGGGNSLDEFIRDRVGVQ